MLGILIGLGAPIAVLLGVLAITMAKKAAKQPPEPVNQHGRQWALYVDAETKRRRDALAAMQQEDSYWLRDVYERKDNA